MGDASGVRSGMAVGDLARIRAGVVRIVDRGDDTVVIGPRVARTFSGESAELLRSVLEIHGEAVTRAELLGELAVRAGGDLPTVPVDALVALLVEDGVLVTPRGSGPMACVGRRVVLA